MASTTSSSTLSSSSSTSLPRVVIVGGGYGGAAVAQALVQQNKKKKIVDVTLIDPKAAFFHIIGAPRGVVDEAFAAKLFVPYSTIVGPTGHHVQSKVSSVNLTAKTLGLENGDQVSFDTLVLATGSKYAPPIHMTSLDSGAAFRAKISGVTATSKIVVIGGGAAGLEIAAEIAGLPSKPSVKLIHQQQQLLNSRAITWPEKFTKKLSAYLARHHPNLELLPGTSVVSYASASESADAAAPSDDTVMYNQRLTLSSGTIVEADIVIKAIGSRLRTELFPSLSDSLTEGGKNIKVNEYLQLPSYPNVYALGDVVNEHKLAMTAGVQAEVVAKNVIAELLGKKDRKKFKAAPTNKMIIVALGRGRGLGLLGGMTIEALGKFKSGEFFLSKFEKLGK